MPTDETSFCHPIPSGVQDLGSGYRSAAGSRAFDLGLGLFACGVFTPFFAVSALWIKWDDGGPVFFRQARLGQGRKSFAIFKFRTMRGGQEVTHPGRWLRRTGLDETAQFLNMLRGDMRMVGPRPLTSDDVTRLGWQSPQFDGRWTAKPGITGMAQVFGGRSARHSRRLDELYGRRQSLRLDCWLIAASFAMNLFGKKLVREKLRALRRRQANRRGWCAVERAC